MKTLLSLLIISSVFGCTQFLQNNEADYGQIIKSNETKYKVYFSGNINGETHPCGCRKFPRGGFPQVYAYLNQNKKTPRIYVDAGDTFFNLPNIPQHLINSAKFKAKKIAYALDQLELKLITPGESDFALGENFLVEISKNYKFEFLISNSTKEMKIKHKKLAHFQINEENFFFIGVIEPTLMAKHLKSLVTSPIPAIEEQIKIIETDYAKLKKKRIFLISHSGLKKDKLIAKNLNKINWILGAHSLSFLQNLQTENKTHFGHTLSQNHFLGEITLDSVNKKYIYKMVEMKESLQDSIKDNHMIPWLVNFKKEYDSMLEAQFESEVIKAAPEPMPTYSKCISCHTQQVDFWKQTSHSLAFQTLEQKSESNNPACIGCHSLGHRDLNGFSSKKNIIQFTSKESSQKQYWSEFSKDILVKGKSIRGLSNEKRAEVSDRWIKLDNKHKVENNYANVQCLHCHNQTADHPFDLDKPKTKMNFQTSCVECHTSDQSPEWYDKDSKGLATTLNSQYFEQKLKQVSCPKIEK